jgi:ABC-type transport system involved in multi-copper enzyme maturation permease subunit
VNPLLEIWIIVARELRKNFRSIKGIALLVLSVLAGAVFALVYAYVERKAPDLLGQSMGSSDMGAIRERLFLEFYGNEELAKHLAPSPYALAGTTGFTLWIVPLLIAIVGFDGISGEVQHRSVRFWVARARKSSYYAGKFLGLWLTITAMLFVINLIVWIVIGIYGSTAAGSVVGWGLRYFVVVIPVVGAWTALAVLIASQFRTPLVSLLTVCTTFFVVFIANKVGAFVTFMKVQGGNKDARNWMDYIYPSGFDRWLLHPSPKEWGVGLALSLVFIVTCSGAGIAIFQKRDV